MNNIEIWLSSLPSVGLVEEENECEKKVNHLCLLLLSSPGPEPPATPAHALHQKATKGG